MNSERCASRGHRRLPLEVHEAGLMALQIHEAALMELGYEGGGLAVHVRLPDPPPPVLVARPDLPGDVPRLAVGLIIVPALVGLEAEAGRRLTSSHSSSSGGAPRSAWKHRSLVGCIIYREGRGRGRGSPSVGGWVDGFLGGERHYTKLKGDTGPLVYPAGFLYVYSAIKFLTGGEPSPPSPPVGDFSPCTGRRNLCRTGREIETTLPRATGSGFGLRKDRLGVDTVGVEEVELIGCEITGDSHGARSPSSARFLRRRIV
ncbi:hypothetical protein BHE74_00012640 [Ensete ventricosum]|nr:hypothetical protein BHE74_00012640 [Ensete ventricosum]